MLDDTLVASSLNSDENRLKRDTSSMDDSNSKRLKVDPAEEKVDKYETMQPRLKKFLKIYQLSSRNSLSGPNQSDIEMSLSNKSLETNSLNIIANVAAAAAAVEAENEDHEQEEESKKKEELVEKSKKKFLKSNLKYLKCMQADQDTSQLMETLLHGERISCFIVGGEKRLCLHDILNTILKNFSVQQINTACQKLSIACLEATPRQLDILKRNHLLPPGAPNCGLLTQTNSERLCAFLMDSSLSEPVPLETPPSSTSSSPAALTPSALKVFHECFGKTYGHVHLNMYSRYDSACVECDSCRKLYSPKNFVCHSHKTETNTRHWGFDSSNWRIYLKLSNSNEEKSVLTDVKISNKDNIAANNNLNKEANDLNTKEKYYLIQEEEFEMFKQKFLNQENKANKLLPLSLSDLNNQIKKNTDQKLLNGLLSKPLNEVPLVQQNSNQPNIVIQNNSINMEHLIKTVTPNKSSNKVSQQPQPQTPKQQQTSSYTNNMLNSKYKQTYPSLMTQSNLTSPYLLQVPNNNSIESNMLDVVLNEIDLAVSNKESADRLKQLVTQMQSYFMEKLYDHYYMKNKYLSEFEEYKIGLQSENEQLKCQLKLIQFQNELSKNDSYLLKKTSPNSTLNINNMLNKNNNNMNQQSSTSTSTSTSPSSVLSSHSSLNSKSQTQQQNATALLQNFLLLQNQQNNSNLAQSLPFLLNHYTNGLNVNTNQQQRSILEPLTSTPIKFNSNKYMNTNGTSSSIKNEQNSKNAVLNTQTSTTA
ncbi:unnamed protein product [Brachionus calyciflorus]|uniref:c-SKI SMAD4-binding domain-containing protein n=1 Tax=Brachionus calyciflorus TaxID=104777 RepID=A0A813Y4L7_9BILA|nr:unnamed protein product [Brachionus calyciflorus]